MRQPRKKKDWKGGLILTRRRKERIVLSTDEKRIVVTLLEVNGGRATLHFAAPPEVKIVRGEIEGEE